MNRTKFRTWLTLSAVIVLLLAAGCKPNHPPSIPEVTGQHVYRPGDTAKLSAMSTDIDIDSVSYLFAWVDSSSAVWSAKYPSGVPATGSHVYAEAGAYEVRIRAKDDKDAESDWAATETLRIGRFTPSVPIAPTYPASARIDTTYTFSTSVASPYSESIRIQFDWAGTQGAWRGPFASGSVCTDTHSFTLPGGYTIRARCQDKVGVLSAWSDSVMVTVGPTGGVKWFWQNGAYVDEVTSAVVVASDGTDEVTMGCCASQGTFLSVKVADGSTKASASPKDPGASFVSDPGLASNGHIIVGDDDGEIYALNLGDLSEAWQWPDSAAGSGTYILWGAPALSGADIYVGHDDETLYHFVDGGSSVTVAGVYGLRASVVDAPVVDASGNVIVGTDSGYLIKFDRNLNAPIWRTHLITFGEVNGVIIGTDGTIYCGSDSPHVYAVDPNTGNVKWATRLDAPGIRPVLGRSALFIGTDRGFFYSINPSTGAVNWCDSLSPGSGFWTAPIVAANGYVYTQNDDDVLYCLNQATGSRVWSCNCPGYLPHGRSAGSHRPKTLGLTGNRPNSSITSTGDIIVVGVGALYYVVGFADGPLDGAAAWPKWQKNRSNTGSLTGK